MGDIIGMKYTTVVRLNPDDMEKVSEIINESTTNVETEYKNLVELENTLYGETSGDLSVDLQNAIENIEQCVETTKKILMEVSETVKGYVDGMRKADEEAAIKAAGGGVHYE